MFDPTTCPNCERKNEMTLIGSQPAGDPQNPTAFRIHVERRCANCGLVLANNSFMGKSAETATFKAIEMGWVLTEKSSTSPSNDDPFGVRQIRGGR